MMNRKHFTACFALLLLFLSPALGGVPIVLFNQSSLDLTSINFLIEDLNISYHMSDSPNALNISNITLWHKTNTSASEVFGYSNGSILFESWQSMNFTANTTFEFNWTIDDDAIAPGIYPLDPKEIGNDAHLNHTLNGVNKVIKSQLFNVSNITQFGEAELMIFRRPGASIASLWYANSSYTSGNLDVNGNACMFGSIDQELHNHTHEANSSYMTIPVGINVTDGTLCGVKVTNDSFFMVRSTDINGWNASYAITVARADQTQVSSNRGVTWANIAGTWDIHLHQFSIEENFWHYACATDIPFEGPGCSILTNDTLALADIPPTAPNVFFPKEGNQLIGSVLDVNYTAAISPSGSSIAYYNVTVVNTTFDFNATVTNNNSLNLSTTWDTTGFPSAGYHIRVEALDVNGLNSFGFSALVSLSVFRTNESSSVNEKVEKADVFYLTFKNGVTDLLGYVFIFSGLVGMFLVLIFLIREDGN